MATSKKTPAAAKPCPPGHHRMPDGSCMPDSEMPERARRSSPRRRSGGRKRTSRTRY